MIILLLLVAAWLSLKIIFADTTSRIEDSTEVELAMEARKEYAIFYDESRTSCGDWC